MSLFGDAQVHGGSITADDVILDFPGGGAAEGALVQQVNFTINRTVNMIYEIGSSNVYYVGNRRQGQAQFNRIVGGSDTFITLLTTYGDMCLPEDLVLSAGVGGGCANGGVQYVLKEATLTSVGASVTAQDIVVTETLGFIFLDLEAN